MHLWNLFAFVCSFVDNDLEAGLSIPGSLPSVTVNGLHMRPAIAAYSNILAYSNVRVDYFS